MGYKNNLYESNPANLMLGLFSLIYQAHKYAKSHTNGNADLKMKDPKTTFTQNYEL
jgi:hypothetical protein